MLPLAGITVVTLEQAVAAPTCTCRLADAGARVIKIERPEGDFARYYDDLAHGESAYFVWLNRGKESCVLDLAQAADMCVQTHGGFGFAEEYDIERKFRETRLYTVAPVSNNLILAYLGQHVLGLPRSY